MMKKKARVCCGEARTCALPDASGRLIGILRNVKMEMSSMLFRHVHSFAFLTVLLFALPAGSGAQAAQTEEALPTAAELDELILDVRAQIDGIDLKTASLENEEKSLMDQARATQRNQFDLQERILEGDKELRDLAEQIEAAQRDLRALQETYAQLLAEQPEFAEQRTRQNAVLERTGAIQRETLELANDRVRLQLELQELEKQRADMAGDAGPEPGNDGATPAAEDSDQL